MTNLGKRQRAAISIQWEQVQGWGGRLGPHQESAKLLPGRAASLEAASALPGPIKAPRFLNEEGMLCTSVLGPT